MKEGVRCRVGPRGIAKKTQGVWSMRSRLTLFNRGYIVVFAKRFTWMIFAIVVLVLPAVGQDQMILGPRQFERDNSGRGAVLCIWAIYLSIQAQTAHCGLARRPVDDAIDEAIVAIDEFIIKNSSLHPTRQMLEDFKRRAAESERSHFLQRRSLKEYCENPDTEHFRRVEADQLRAGVQRLLEIEREPVMNPCL
jgi:hypothetical protein